MRRLVSREQVAGFRTVFIANALWTGDLKTIKGVQADVGTVFIVVRSLARCFGRLFFGSAQKCKPSCIVGIATLPAFPSNT